MTRNELLKKWCAAEGGKKSAMDAPQAREAYAKLRAIIGEFAGIDLDDVIKGDSYAIATNRFENRPAVYGVYRLYIWENGKPVKPASRKSSAKAKRGGK